MHYEMQYKLLWYTLVMSLRLLNLILLQLASLRLL